MWLCYTRCSHWAALVEHLLLQLTPAPGWAAAATSGLLKVPSRAGKIEFCCPWIKPGLLQLVGDTWEVRLAVPAAGDGIAERSQQQLVLGPSHLLLTHVPCPVPQSPVWLSRALALTRIVQSSSCWDCPCLSTLLPCLPCFHTSAWQNCKNQHNSREAQETPLHSRRENKRIPLIRLKIFSKQYFNSLPKKWEIIALNIVWAKQAEAGFITSRSLNITASLGQEIQLILMRKMKYPAWFWTKHVLWEALRSTCFRFIPMTWKLPCIFLIIKKHKILPVINQYKIKSMGDGKGRKI